MATKIMGMAKIGPAAWRNSTLTEIKQSSNLIKTTDKFCLKGRTNDPLPNLRDVVAELSNDEAHRYFREARAVVSLLRENLVDTNEEIKALNNTKERLERIHEHIRKDLKLNADSQFKRSTRPPREKEEDAADNMLIAERQQLRNLKKMIDSQLELVQQQLQILDASRKRLAAVLQERSRVVELICAAIPSASAGAQTSRSIYKPSTRTVSACGNMRSSVDTATGPQIDPLGAYTPECDAALGEAKDARARSGGLRRQSDAFMANVRNTQTGMHLSVNDGLTAKVAETVTLKQQLELAQGENRHATNRAQRYFDKTETAWSSTRGPLMLEDYTTREKMDRPIMRVFQRHPGNNLPEAQHCARAGNSLLEALRGTSQNIGMMKMARLRLKDDISDKKSGIHIDSDVTRMRRRKANHRWVMGEAF